MTTEAAPTIIELKQRLNGTNSEYECELVAQSPGKAVILYRLPPGASFLSLDLPPHSLSFGYFWEDRPYNVYHWVRPDGSSAGWYCNVADRTHIGDGRVAWRDLILDVLALPGAAPAVLDRDELPADLDPALMRYIEEAISRLLLVLPELTAEIAAESAGYLSEVNARADILD